jgi:tRNA (guanine37-N1)-methyltransferase
MALYDVDEVSIGDYILTGGEPAAAVMLDAVARLIPRVLGNFESALRDSYMDQPLGSPCYTRPPEYEGLGVPEVLMSGDHKKIDKFRRREGLAKCFRNRPELLEKAELSGEEIDILNDLKATKTK